MFWCEHFEGDFKYRPIFKEVHWAILLSKGEVGLGLIVQQVVPSLTVNSFHPPVRALRFKAEQEPAVCRPKADKKIM